MKTQKQKFGYFLLFVLVISALMGIFIKQPIAQDMHYHNFSDVANITGIPNFWNVISNVPFAVVGFMGLYKLKIVKKLKIINQSKIVYVLFFAGILLITFGSGYYHLHPTNDTLVWDRLPMTIVFMSLFSIIISEFISINMGKILFLPLISTGILSVIYWHFTEFAGAGDLRLYALVQFYPMLGIPIILLCFNSRFTDAKAYWLLLLAYVIAKSCEHFDMEIHRVLHIVSGHSLKHFIAAMGLYIVLHAYEKREVSIIRPLA